MSRNDKFETFVKYLPILGFSVPMALFALLHMIGA